MSKHLKKMCLESGDQFREKLGVQKSNLGFQLLYLDKGVSFPYLDILRKFSAAKSMESDMSEAITAPTRRW